MNTELKQPVVKDTTANNGLQNCSREIKCTRSMTMNENIKELARRCNFTEQDIENMSPGFEKFAELIVQECINTIEKSDAECSDEWDYVERNLSALIKEHFGGKIA